MKQRPEQTLIPTVVGDQVSVMLNWTPESKREFIKLRVGNKEAVIPRSAWVRFAMMIAKEEEQASLVPVKQMKIRHFSKTITLQLKKNMHAGEYLYVPVSFDVPLTQGALTYSVNASSDF